MVEEGEPEAMGEGQEGGEVTDTKPRILWRKDLDRFQSLVDQYQRSGSTLRFEDWVERREEAVAHLYSRMALDDHSSDIDPETHR